MTSSRGSDPFLPPTSHPTDALMSPDTPDDDQGSAKLDEEAEEEEEEANEVIIYPPSEESITSPERYLEYFINKYQPTKKSYFGLVKRGIILQVQYITKLSFH